MKIAWFRYFAGIHLLSFPPLQPINLANFRKHLGRYRNYNSFLLKYSISSTSYCLFLTVINTLQYAHIGH